MAFLGNGVVASSCEGAFSSVSVPLYSTFKQADMYSFPAAVVQAVHISLSDCKEWCV